MIYCRSMDEKTLQEQERMKSSLLAAVDLMEMGIALMRQNIARNLKGATPEIVDAELRRWLIEQPADFIPGAKD